MACIFRDERWAKSERRELSWGGLGARDENVAKKNQIRIALATVVVNSMELENLEKSEELDEAVEAGDGWGYLPWINRFTDIAT